MTALPRIVRASPADALAVPFRSALSRPAPRAAGCGRRYATNSSFGGAPKSSSTRRQVTVANDDGHVRWGDLSAREKAARSTQQSFNFMVVIAGVLATVCRRSYHRTRKSDSVQGAVTYVIYTEVLSPEGATNQYHRSLRKIKEDPKCVELLGNPKKWVARGEHAHSRMARNWTISYV